jgi:hypothetical protein
VGSAFYAEPLYGLDPHEVVTFATWFPEDDAFVVHLAHAECEVEHPHRMSECGRFRAEKESR